MNIILLILVLLCSTSSLAQQVPQFTPYDDQIPGIIKSHKPSYDATYPDWAKELYAYPANAITVRNGLTAYLQQYPDAHSAIIRYAKQWLHAIAEYEDEHGMVHIPEISQDQQNIKQEETFAGKGNWSFWGRMYVPAVLYCSGVTTLRARPPT